MKLRRATARDLPILVEHRHRMWEELSRTEAHLREISPARLAATDRIYRRWLKEHLARGRLYILLGVEKDGRIVASGTLWFREDVPRPHRPQTVSPYITTMYTVPEFRRRGWGAAILERLIAASRAKGFRRIRLHTSPLGRPLYQAIGFTPSSEMQFDL